MTLLPRQSDEELLRIAKERNEKRRDGMLRAYQSATSAEPLPPPHVPLVVRDLTDQPKRVRLPWSVLVPDNAKYRVGTAKNGKPLLRLTPEYRDAKKRAVETICDQIGAAPFPGAVRVEARLYVPNRERTRDVANHTKLVHDALTGYAYTDDSQIAELLWVRAGEDIDAPRLEITVTPL